MAQLVEYVKKNIAKGYTLESLRWALINQGHSRVEVNRAIAITNQELAQRAPVLKEKPIIKVETIPIVEEDSSFFKKLKHLFR